MASIIEKRIQDMDRLEAVAEELDRKDDGIHIVSVQDFLGKEFPPRENVLTPWLPSQGLVMCYSPRGVGKTHVALGIGYAVASGGTFLKWSAPKARGVLLLDGEMPAVALQERLARIANSAEKEPAAPFQILTPDLQKGGMPDLSDLSWQAELDARISDEIGLIIADNLSTLARSGKENESESWSPVQAWALRHRAAGRSILFMHHAGKGGQQRGTSRREDVLDTVITLRHPVDYNPEQGAVFEIRFEKARGIHGQDVESFEARLTTTADGRDEWVMRSVDDTMRHRVVTMLKDGMSQADIARELNLNRSTVSRHAKHARECGELPQ